MAEEMDPTQAYEHYMDSANLVPAGAAHRPVRPAKSSMVPVRFAPDMIAAVKRFAGYDGMTVSTWIRRLVAKEIERRQPPATSTAPAEPTAAVQMGDPPTSSTVAMTTVTEPVLVVC